MARFAHRPMLMALFLLAAAAAAALLLSLEISSSQAAVAPSAAPPVGVSRSAPVSVPETGAGASGPTATAPGAPSGRRNPLVALPRSGTPTLTVRPGRHVELRSSPGGKVAAELTDETEFGSPTVLSVTERRGNWAGVPTQLLANGDLGWVKLEQRDLRIDSVGKAIVIDLSAMSAELTAHGEVERRWQVGIGAPGTETPTGHFSITDELPNDFNPTYGCCVLPLSAIQPNLPAGWTGGDRMAIHGTSLPLGEANSTGCVHSSEADLRALLDAAPLGTPVTIKR